MGGPRADNCPPTTARQRRRRRTSCVVWPSLAQGSLDLHSFAARSSQAASAPAGSLALAATHRAQVAASAPPPLPRRCSMVVRHSCCQRRARENSSGAGIGGSSTCTVAGASQARLFRLPHHTTRPAPPPAPDDEGAAGGARRHSLARPGGTSCALPAPRSPPCHAVGGVARRWGAEEGAAKQKGGSIGDRVSL